MGELVNRGESAIVPEVFYKQVSSILNAARDKAYTAVNFAMVEAYWEIGKSIVDEQGGEERAAYGEALIAGLSRRLTADFGRGFGIANLRNMRQFFLAFPIRDALRSELSWTHYRLLMRVENENAREFYMQEAVKSQWSTRQLERQINSFFYERLLSSKNKEQNYFKYDRSSALFVFTILHKFYIDVKKSCHFYICFFCAFFSAFA